MCRGHRCPCRDLWADRAVVGLVLGVRLRLRCGEGGVSGWMGMRWMSEKWRVGRRGTRERRGTLRLDLTRLGLNGLIIFADVVGCFDRCEAVGFADDFNLRGGCLACGRWAVSLALNEWEAV